MISHQEIGLTRIIRKVAPNATRLSSNSYRLNAQSSKHKVKQQNKRQEYWLNAPGLALLLLGVSALDLCWLRRFLMSLLHVVYRKYASMRHQHKCNAWGAKYKMLHDHEYLNHINLYMLFY
jgi:hypothetical protein